MFGLQPGRNRGVHCIRFVGRRLHMHLLRSHSDRSEPLLYQLWPFCDRELRAPQPKGVSALCIQMQFHGNLGVPERDGISHRVSDIIHRVILGLEQERRRRIAGDRDVGI